MRETRLLDTPPEETFDRLTRLASRVLRVPVAFFALVDEDRDFYKSQCGFDEPLKTTRELTGRTFCHHALLSDGPLLFADTLSDPVARAVPTTRSLGVRAYAGIPLRTQDGLVVGSFCAVDFEPREWSDEDVEVLSELGHAVLREVQLRRALRSARENEALAQQASKRREEVLAVVAHDLRAPIHAIRATAEVMLDEVRRSEREAMARTILVAARKMNALVEELLEPPTEAASELCRVQSAPRFLVEDAVSLFDGIARRQGSTLDFRCAGDLPDVCVDYDRALRALSNLIGNALKFGPSGQKVEVEVSLVDGQVRFAVVDRGPGLSEQQMARAFEEHWQANPGDGQGQGLGLSIVKRVAEAHGGRVGVTSEVGVGSTFFCSFPASLSPSVGARSAEAFGATPPARPGQPSSSVGEWVPATGEPRTVLIVDDEQIVRRLAVRVLSQAGYRCLEAESGERALELLREYGDSVCAMLLDYNLPGLRGDEVIARVRATRSALPIVVSSGARDAMAMQQSGVAYLPKPYLSKELLMVVRGARDRALRGRPESN